jgi:hypothetical protein
MELAKLKEAGRAAFRAGLRQMANPSFDVANMPIQTNESCVTWQAKVDAWESGWCDARATDYRPPT